MKDGPSHEDDPPVGRGETHDLSAEMPALLEELRTAWERYAAWVPMGARLEEVGKLPWADSRGAMVKRLRSLVN